MKRIGLLVGREKSFPEALIAEVNKRGGGEVEAEFVEIGGVRLDEARRYDIIIDRISHEVPFYRGYLKRMALEGTHIINNPFWWSADDKFFNYSLAAKLGVAVPRTALLPQKSYIEGITSESLRNLQYPLDWQGVVDYVGLPAILKPFDGGGWKNVSRINSLEQLWQVYDQTGTLCMTLQEFIDFDQFVRCYCIGQSEVMIMPYDPRKPYLSGEQYLHNPHYLTPELAERVTANVRTLCQALGYDINTVEFAIKDGVPYAIDFMNPAPDADVLSVGEFYHGWVTQAVTNLIFKRLQEPHAAPRYRWDALLNPGAQTFGERIEAVASAAEQAARTLVPKSVQDVGSEIVSGVGVLVGDAVQAVSEIVDSVIEAQPKKKRGLKSGEKTESAPKRKPSGKKSAPPADIDPATNI